MDDFIKGFDYIPPGLTGQLLALVFHMAILFSFRISSNFLLAERIVFADSEAGQLARGPTVLLIPWIFYQMKPVI